ncbi:MAG: hypothetical protein HY842_05275 [Bacteroidetes bacterium]|nr:hypothetical protein [Bacteroidota bacterium]
MQHSEMTNKRLTALTQDDLLDKRVWEHWYEDNTEYVKQSDKEEIFEDSDIGHIVLTDFMLNNQTKHLGYCSPQDPSGIDYIQPTIFTDNGQVEFYNDIGWTSDNKRKALEKLRLDWQDVFPIVYKTRIKCDGEFYSGIIVDFNEGK